MFFIEISGNRITGKGEISIHDIELKENQIEVTEEMFKNIQLPSIVEFDSKGDIASITPEYIEPKIIDDKVDEEKVAIAEAIVDLDARLSVLEGGGEE